MTPPDGTRPGADRTAVGWFDAEIGSIDRVTEPGPPWNGKHRPVAIRLLDWSAGCPCGWRKDAANAGLAVIAARRHRRETAKRCYKCRHSRIDHCWAADRDGSRWWACLVGKCKCSIRRRWP